MRAVVVALLALGACAEVPVKVDLVPEVGRPVVVERGVLERCRVELPPEPSWLWTPFAADKSIALFDWYRRALAEIEQRKEYEGRVKAAATKCE